MSNQPGCGRNRRTFTSRTALERLSQVDALFRARGGTVTISEAQEALGWSRGCIFDCCRELLRRGVLVQDSAGGYRIPGTGLEDRVARLELALTETVAYLVARPLDAAGRNLVDAIGAALGPEPAPVPEATERRQGNLLRELRGIVSITQPPDRTALEVGNDA